MNPQVLLCWPTFGALGKTSRYRQLYLRKPNRCSHVLVGFGQQKIDGRSSSGSSRPSVTADLVLASLLDKDDHARLPRDLSFVFVAVRSMFLIRCCRRSHFRARSPFDTRGASSRLCKKLNHPLTRLASRGSRSLSRPGRASYTNRPPRDAPVERKHGHTNPEGEVQRKDLAPTQVPSLRASSHVTQRAPWRQN